MSGVIAEPEGITRPPIDELLDRVDSKYALVVYAAKRARQINTYNQQVADGMFSTPGPLVPVTPEDKPLSIALREINEDLLSFTTREKAAAGAADSEIDTTAAQLDTVEIPADLSLPTDFS